MNEQIEFYVEQMEAALMMELLDGNKPNLQKIAENFLATDEEQYTTICQAYEVVKHDLLGDILN